MKIAARLLFSLYIGFFAASLVYYLYSPIGYRAYHQLQGEIARLETNLQELKDLHKELSGEFESLRRSSETVIVRARDLGYAQGGETFLQVEGLNTLPKNYYSVGRIIAPQLPRTGRNAASLITGMIAMAAAFLLLAIISTPPGRPERSAHN